MDLETDKLCINCKHVSKESEGDYSYVYRCEVEVFNPVIGQRGKPNCEISRLSQYLCGPIGRYYEHKEESNG